MSRFIYLVFLSTSITSNILCLYQLFLDFENCLSLFGCFPFSVPTFFPEVICSRYDPAVTLPFLSDWRLWAAFFLSSLLLHFSHYIFLMATKALALNIFKAFDRVWYTGLLQKLKSYGVSDQIFDLILSFLSNRHLLVVLDGKVSK